MNYQTLEEAREALRDNLGDGMYCPCCTQFAKMYKRALSSHMVIALIGLYKCFYEGDKAWYHVRDFVPKGQTGAGDYAFMRFWGLIEKNSEESKEDKKSNGLWRITERGREFVRGRLTVQSHAFIYNGKLNRLYGDYKNIKECLGKKFSYSELMSKIF